MFWENSKSFIVVWSDFWAAVAKDWQSFSKLFVRRFRKRSGPGLIPEPFPALSAFWREQLKCSRGRVKPAGSQDTHHVAQFQFWGFFFFQNIDSDPPQTLMSHRQGKAETHGLSVSQHQPQTENGKKEHHENICDAVGFVTGFSGGGRGGRGISQSPNS